MAVTWAASIITEGVASTGKRVKQALLTPTGTYTTGGDALPLAQLGLKGMTALTLAGLEGFANPGFNISPMGTVEAPLLKLYETNNTEVAGATTITGRAAYVRIEGY